MRESLQKLLWFKKIILSTMRGTSSFLHDDEHLRHYPTAAMQNHTEFLFKSLGLGMKLFDKCLTLRESPKLPVLSINNSTRAIIIPKKRDALHLRRWTFDPFDVPSCGLVKWGGTH